MRRRAAMLCPPHPDARRDPDQDPALWTRAATELLQALAALRLRPLRPGDSRAVSAHLFPGVDAYFFKLVRGVSLRPELFPNELLRRLQRKSARIAGWETLRGVLQTTLTRVAASLLREQSELLLLCQQIEDFVRSTPDGATEAVQHQRFLQIRSALQVRDHYRRGQARLGRKGGRATATRPHRAQGLAPPARDLSDLEVRELMEALMRRGRP